MPEAMSTEHLKHYVCETHQIGWACGDGPDYMPCPYCERERTERAEAEHLQFAMLARHLIRDVHPFGGLDGADIQETLTACGLLEPVTITEMPCKEGGCNCCDVDSEVGDICYRPPEWVRDAITAAPDFPSTSQGGPNHEP